ncbi:tRNA isopentenyltransferase [Echria macrotheca]|uniref:tRNA dimethylallyltransferase n=1 Tax=Echria macrotheca TaxID=438768 RepID=A0AAJ0FAS6_9PEZI|nr:tRNA isopentenyltransferase [Echria macrotheca]
MEPLIVIFGSTGTGKSDLAVELASRFNGEIINADAMQMYRGLPIITNKLSIEDQRGIPHHLLGNIGLDEDPWSVVHFKREASKIISEIRNRGKLPIVVGGTTYYLDGLLFEDRLVTTHASTEGSITSREELLARYPILSAPADVMLAKLREIDPVMADRWHPNDVRKISNSLEIYYTTGRRASDIYAEQRKQKESKSAAQESDVTKAPRHVLLFWLYAERDPLNLRLDSRVDKMVQNGLVREVAEVYDWYQSRLSSGETPDRSRGIVQSIGFWQFEPYLRAARNSPASPELAKLKQDAIENTKTATRRYAKYQVRWITMKTLASLQAESLLDRLYLLDSTDNQGWHDAVAAKGVELTARFLAGEPIPPPASTSETAQTVLASCVERSNRQVTPCNKTCTTCEKTFLTEELWQKHITSKVHAKAVRLRTRSSVVPFKQQKTAIVVADSIALEKSFPEEAREAGILCTKDTANPP